jgi:hypothetical protein
MGANRPSAPFPVHPAVELAKLEVLAAFCGHGELGPAREKLRLALELHHPRELRHPDQLEPTTLRSKDAFERRRLVRNKFLGPVSSNAYSGKPYENYNNLLADGWTITILLNDKVRHDALGADPDKGEVYFSGVTLKGTVEVRMERGK